MRRRKPVLLVPSAICLFIAGAIFVFSSLGILSLGMGYTSPSNGTSELLPAQTASIAVFLALFFMALGVLYIASGVGLLKRKEWARVAAAIIFFLSILGSLSPNISQSGSPYYQLGQLFGKLLTLLFSSLGLYAMTFDKEIQNYFKTRD